MYYRRKVLLSLIQAFDNNLEKIRLQKLLFLLNCFQSIKHYHFVPYKYGCYSFQANSDLKTLAKYNAVEDDNNVIHKTDSVNYLHTLKQSDRIALNKVKNLYGSKSTEELVKSTYISHPYYAINSITVERILNKEELNRVVSARPVKNKTILYTIGYEGISLEEYLNKLILNDVRVLCDVRNNALSMKFGFSKTQLEKACKAVGIQYVHLPKVGIESSKRQELHSQNDYDKLFIEYKHDVLANNANIQKNILNLLIDNERIALTCFEADICQCHRKPLAEAITNLEGWQYELKHI